MVEGETEAPPSRRVPQSKLGMEKAKLPEPQDRAGLVVSGENGGETHSLMDKKVGGRAFYLRPGDAS
jgi:hypothetical protein